MNKLYIIIALIILNQSIIAQAPFITTWKTDNKGTSCNSCITIPTNPNYTYNYSVDWNNDGIYDTTNVKGTIVHDFKVAGEYTIRLIGKFPAIQFHIYRSKSDAEKIISIDQWGDIIWKDFERAFNGTTQMIADFIDTPNIINVRNMSHAFAQTKEIKGDITTWDVGNITNMQGLFAHSPSFNQDIGNWDVRNVTDMSYLFYQNVKFNQDIGTWNVSKVNDMANMFGETNAFNQNISNWDVSNVQNMRRMFAQTKEFNQNIGMWKVQNVTDMRAMFAQAKAFNQNIENWSVGNVKYMQWMFANTKVFNQPIGKWDVSNVIDMSGMFSYSEKFNQSLIKWNVSKVKNMQYMFYGYTNVFNQPIGEWNVGKVFDMSYMFSRSKVFNQNLNNWDVSRVENMRAMFYESLLFNQTLGAWDLHRVNLKLMLHHCGLSQQNYELTLLGWSKLKVYYLELGSLGLKYCKYKDRRESLISKYGWKIRGDQLNCTTPSQNETKDKPLLSIYPNPSIKNITIDLQNINGQSIRLDIFNNTGKIIQSYHVNPESSVWNKELSINESGIYYIKVISDSGSICKKVVVL